MKAGSKPELKQELFLLCTSMSSISTTYATYSYIQTAFMHVK